jgi:hypothetical protein
MRIAQVAPPLEAVPPAKYGGTEFVVGTLTEELVRRGHDVTLFAASGSRTSARLVPVVDQALWHHPAVYEELVEQHAGPLASPLPVAALDYLLTRVGAS